MHTERLLMCACWLTSILTSKKNIKNIYSAWLFLFHGWQHANSSVCALQMFESYDYCSGSSTSSRCRSCVRDRTDVCVMLIPAINMQFWILSFANLRMTNMHSLLLSQSNIASRYTESVVRLQLCTYVYMLTLILTGACLPSLAWSWTIFVLLVRR